MELTYLCFDTLSHFEMGSRDWSDLKLKLTIAPAFLPPASKCWELEADTAMPSLCSAGIEFRAFCMLGKHCTKWVKSSVIFILRQDLTRLFKLTLNLDSTCFHLPRRWTTELGPQTRVTRLKGCSEHPSHCSVFTLCHISVFLRPFSSVRDCLL